MTVLFTIGVLLIVVATVAMFLRASTGVIIAFASIGAVLIGAATVMPRFEEGRLEATSRGVSLEWRKRVTESVGQVLADLPLDPVPRGDGGEETTPERPPRRPRTRVDLADINNDGEVELVVQHPVGNLMTLTALGWQGPSLEPEFGRVAELTSRTPGFTVGDLDGDGRVEVATIEPDMTKEGASMAGPFFAEVLRRWNGTEFAEVGRSEIPTRQTSDDAETATLEYDSLRWFGPLPPSSI